jgi:TatD DNase family protein
MSERPELPPSPDPLPLPVVDNHTHLDIGAASRDSWPEHAAEDMAAVVPLLERAAQVKVTRAVQVGCDLPSARWTAELVSAQPRLVGAVALHPNEVPRLAEAGELDAAYAEIAQLARRPRIRCVGETGLDYFRTPPEGRSVQQASFRWHIALARELDLTLQIHDRDAHDDVVQVLKEEGAPERVVFHCYSGDEELARICNENGWYMSFAGTMTFKNAGNLRAALSIAEPSRILVETDSPFLTPHPYRGRPNASYMVPYTVRSMAEVTEDDLSELCARLAENTVNAYGSWG